MINTETWSAQGMIKTNWSIAIDSLEKILAHRKQGWSQLLASQFLCMCKLKDKIFTYVQKVQI
jgi:hypothetical protein